MQRYGPLLKQHRDKMKDTVVWNIEQGLASTGRASGARWRCARTCSGACAASSSATNSWSLPVNQVPPFPVDLDYPREIAGAGMGNYLDWMKSCYYITITSHPAISVPAAFTPDGLPVGLQIVGRYRDDFGVLQLAHAFEQETQVWKRRPPVAE